MEVFPWLKLRFDCIMNGLIVVRDDDIHFGKSRTAGQRNNNQKCQEKASHLIHPDSTHKETVSAIFDCKSLETAGNCLKDFAMILRVVRDRLSFISSSRDS